MDRPNDLLGAHRDCQPRHLHGVSMVLRRWNHPLTFSHRRTIDYMVALLPSAIGL